MGDLFYLPFSIQVRVNAAVYMAATLEYLVAEVLELAGNCARYLNIRYIWVSFCRAGKMAV